MRVHPIPAFMMLLTLSLLLGAWPVTAAEDARPLQTLIDEVRQKLERAEKERLADPWFIQDMRALLHRFDWPWQVSVYERDFAAERLDPMADFRRHGRNGLESRPAQHR